jgi:hypothetical protein
MSLYEKSTETFEQTFKSLRAIQDAGFNAAAAVAEKTPGLPRRIASTTTRGTNAWVESYFTLAQLVLNTERRAAEQLVVLNKALVFPRPRVEKEQPLQTA